MFCGIVGEVALGGFPVNMKLSLTLSVADPIEAHVHGFGSALDNSVGDDADCTFVVELYRRRALVVSHFLQCGSHGNCVLGVDETRTSFGFLDGGHDGVNNFAVDEDRRIEGRRWVFRFDREFGFIR